MGDKGGKRITRLRKKEKENYGIGEIKEKNKKKLNEVVKIK